MRGRLKEWLLIAARVLLCLIALPVSISLSMSVWSITFLFGLLTLAGAILCITSKDKKSKEVLDFAMDWLFSGPIVFYRFNAGLIKTGKPFQVE